MAASFVIKPRRQTRGLMEKKDQKMVLNTGEIFFELQSDKDTIKEALEAGENTFRMKIGDGNTEYANLPYVEDRKDEPLDFEIYTNDGTMAFKVVISE